MFNLFKNKLFTLKGQSNEIFDLQFFSSFKPAWATDQWSKIFRKISNIFENPKAPNTARSRTPCRLTFREVNN